MIIKPSRLRTLCVLVVIYIIYVISTYLQDFRFNLVPKRMALHDREDMFQIVGNETSIYVYSAYFNSRKHEIRVIGLTNLNWPTLYCLLRYNSTNSKYIKARISFLQDHHGRRYKAIFIVCILKNVEVPKQLTVTRDVTIDHGSNTLTVNVIPTFSTRRNFTVCLSPLHSLYNNKWQLLEWLEMNIILGVEQFYVYVQSCTNDVMKLLQTYQASGYVVIMKWTLPSNLCIPNGTDLHYCGQMAALNDCLYRSKGYSSYVAVLDVDELIIPQIYKDKTWSDMLRRLPRAAVYVFRNVLFNRKNADVVSSLRLVTDSNFFRDFHIYKSHNRSKYIAVTDHIQTLGIHFPWKKGGTEYTVRPSIGLLHHYRRKFHDFNMNRGMFSNITNKYSLDLHKRIVDILLEQIFFSKHYKANILNH